MTAASQLNISVRSVALVPVATADTFSLLNYRYTSWNFGSYDNYMRMIQDTLDTLYSDGIIVYLGDYDAEQYESYCERTGIPADDADSFRNFESWGYEIEDMIRWTGDVSSYLSYACAENVCDSAHEHDEEHCDETHERIYAVESSVSELTGIICGFEADHESMLRFRFADLDDVQHDVMLDCSVMPEALMHSVLSTVLFAAAVTGTSERRSSVMLRTENSNDEFAETGVKASVRIWKLFDDGWRGVSEGEAWTELCFDTATGDIKPPEPQVAYVGTD